MKLTQILAHYLYSNKRLDLPGIGSFLLDPSVVIEPENDKHHKQEPADGIRFEYNTAIKDNTDLVDYIAARSGKMKSLASADLDSHIWLGQQFLNIGKPFVLEGIGQLVKLQNGTFEFSAGTIQSDIMREPAVFTQVPDNSSQPGEVDYKGLLNHRKEAIQWKKPAAILLTIAGIAVAVWGGYTIYKKNTSDRPASVVTQTSNPEPATTPAPSTEPVPAPVTQNDTSNHTNQIIPAATPAGSFKFIVETAGRQRALARYQKLKSLPSAIQLETSDSVTYRLYFVLTASPADTTRLLDSLKLYYTPKWGTAYIAH